MIKVMTIFGTRPEAIKMAPIVLEMKNRSDEFQPVTVVTGQHKEMLNQVMDVFGISEDYNLNIMSKNQTLSDITSRILEKLNPILSEVNPDIVLVHGDTSTTFAASLAAFFNKTPIGHVEAGLRTWDKYSPFPEEMNRQMTDVLTDLYFSPTEETRQNILSENKNPDSIFVTGNTAIDAMNTTISAVNDKENVGNKRIVLTMHRRENQGDNMVDVFKAINMITKEYEDVEFIYPVHLNPVVQNLAKDSFENNDKVRLIQPLDVIEFHNLINDAYFVMSDSGGVQEEAPALDKPVLVLRDTTERPEGVKAGTLKLVGTDTDTVYRAMKQLLDDPDEYKKMASAKNPYGDGSASKQIMDIIAEKLSQTHE